SKKSVYQGRSSNRRPLVVTPRVARGGDQGTSPAPAKSSLETDPGPADHRPSSTLPPRSTPRLRAPAPSAPPATPRRSAHPARPVPGPALAAVPGPHRLPPHAWARPADRDPPTRPASKGGSREHDHPPRPPPGPPALAGHGQGAGRPTYPPLRAAGRAVRAAR